MAVKTASVASRVSKAEACRRTGLRPCTINRLIANGELKVVDLPIRVKDPILADSLDALVARMVASQPANAR